MSLQTRLEEFIAAVGADVKSIQATLVELGADVPNPGPVIPESSRGTVNVTMVQPVPYQVDAPDWVLYPVPNATTAPTVVGMGITTNGTLTASGVLATTSGQARTSRTVYRVTTAAVGAIAHFRQNANTLGPIRADGWGGFKSLITAGPDTGTSIAGDQFFMGVRAATAAPTAVNPSTLMSIIGLGYDATDTNVQIMHNDATGTATKIDTGWAVPSTDSTAFYELELYAPETLGVVKYRATQITATGKLSIEGTISTDLPTNTTYLQAFGYHATGTVSSVVGLAVGTCRGNNSMV